ncbi:hypothetical protein ACHAPU_005669 [Fusarium lateritium]
MATTFHDFGILPKELRDMIWESTLRPTAPGVHLFKIHNRSARTLLEETIAVTPASSTYGARSSQPIMTACTPYPSGSIHGFPGDTCTWWEDGNTSTYHIDRGLWDACEESRSFIGRRTGPVVTIQFVASTEENRHYVVRPSQDIFIYRFKDNPFGYPFITYMPLQFPHNPQLDPRHIGLEFHINWVFQNRPTPRDPRGCAALQQLAAAGANGASLWVIDYGLIRQYSPRRQQDPAENGIAKFHASKRYLVEVKFGTEAGSWGDWVDTHDSGSGSSCPASIEAVRLLDYYRKDYKNIGVMVWKKIGLLGWEQNS